MPIVKINQLPEGSGNLSGDDVFVFMDDPSGNGITKKISLSQISNSIFDQDLNTFNSVAFNQITVNGYGSGNSDGTIQNPTGNLNITTNNSNTWVFGENGDLTFPSGSIISETNNTVSLMPPTAQSGQSLVIRPTAAVWNINSSNYIVYGDPITIVVNQQYVGGNYFGTVNYNITGSGVTQASLGRSLTGNMIFSGPGPETETITWTIPANSDIAEFTLTLTGADGVYWDNIPEHTDPALYYSFESNTMPSGQYVTVTNNGISNSEHSHIHLVAGDPENVDIYLGDDDQYVKIEKDGGDVVVGTNLNNNQWTFDTDGNLRTPTNSIISKGYPGQTQDASSWFVSPSGSTGGLASADGEQYIQISNNNEIYIGLGWPANHPIEWTFNRSGELTLPASGSITFPDNTVQTSAGISSSTGLVPNSASITNIVSISQANYDAIVTKNSSTLYVIS